MLQSILALFFLIGSLHSSTIEFFCDEPLSEDYFYLPLRSHYFVKNLELKAFPREERRQDSFLPCPTIFHNFPGEFFSYPLDRSILFLWEPPSVIAWLYDQELVQRAFRVYTWDDDLVDQKRFFKFYYPSMQQMIRNLPSFHTRALCTQVSRNKKSSHPNELYSAREEVIRFFDSILGNDFTFYGQGWEASGYRHYGGAPLDKIQTIKHFRFSFCYENITEIRGYVTEKIFDCFTAGVVPIYWGATNITDYVPKNCFIDRRDFSSLEELYRFLKEMPESTWNQYIKNIRHFLRSEKAKLFSWENYLKIMQEAIDALIVSNDLD